MKKHFILSILMIISLIGFSQTQNNDFNELVAKTSQQYNIKKLASNSTIKFKLDEVRSQILVNKKTREKIPQYKLTFIKLDDNSKHSLITSTAKQALFGLNEINSMIIYDGTNLVLISTK